MAVAVSVVPVSLVVVSYGGLQGPDLLAYVLLFLLHASQQVFGEKEWGGGEYLPNFRGG